MLYPILERKLLSDTHLQSASSSSLSAWADPEGGQDVRIPSPTEKSKK